MVKKTAIKICLVWLAMLLPCGCNEVGNTEIGGPCNKKDECASGLCFHNRQYGENTGWTDGYCTSTCKYTCPSEALCTPFGDDFYCLGKCESDDMCRTGYLCNPWLGVCLPDCNEDWQCGEGLECNDDGFCLDPANHTGNHDRLVGAPCLVDFDCESNMCIKQESTVQGFIWLNGMCSEHCDECSEYEACVSILESKTCLPRCLDQYSCRAGYACDFTQGACVPDCRYGFECNAGMFCGQYGICEDLPSR